MPVNIIDTLKPKNGLNFPVVEAIDVFVEDYENLADAISHFATDVMIEAINTVLSGKANASDVNTAVTSLQGQIDQIVISASAESVVAPEVAAARVGADGTSYQTLKARCDADYAKHAKAEEQLDNDTTQIKKFFYSNNLLALKTKVLGAFYSNKENASNSYNYYKYIPVKSGKTYKFGFTARFVSVFDTSKTYISNSENLTSFTASSDGYVHVTVASSVDESALKMYESTVNVNDVYPLTISDLAKDVPVLHIKEEAFVDICNTAKKLLEGYYNPTTGAFTIDASYYTSEPIDISDVMYGTTITIPSSLNGDMGVVVFDSAMTPLFFINGRNASQYGYTTTSQIKPIKLTCPENAKYIVNAIRTAFYTSLDVDMTVTYQRAINTIPNSSVNTDAIIDNSVTTNKLAAKAAVYNVAEEGKNKLNTETSVLNTILTDNGSRTTSYDGYDTSDYIDVSNFENSICVTPRLRKFCQYDENKDAITDTYEDDQQFNYVVAKHQDAKYVRVTYFHGDSIQVEDNTAASFYEPYSLYLDNELNAINDKTRDTVEQMINEVASVDSLNGKKWIPCGDSFTDYTNATFSAGQFIGKSKSYPRLIAERTGIIINQNFFASGRTMAYPADHTFTNSLTCPSCAGYYQNIPEDADYITIMLGINDVNHMNGSGTTPDGEDATGVITLGTINDTTTDTYYGAYNTVLSWLRENRPFAHVGIIVTNGTQRQDYTEAQIAVAKKWGYPYFDLNGDEKTPAMIRCYNPNMSEDLKTLIKQVQAVDYPTNTHPNYQTHEYESVFIENWLRTL